MVKFSVVPNLVKRDADVEKGLPEPGVVSTPRLADTLAGWRALKHHGLGKNGLADDR
jgi:hypothetical protein